MGKSYGKEVMIKHLQYLSFNSCSLTADLFYLIQYGYIIVR